MASKKLEGALGIQSNEETSLNSHTSGEDFLEDVEESIAKTNNEVERFISDPRKELSMLESYPHIKQIFRKLNTTLPSSGPVERLFSQAALILTARRNRLNDILFEHLILLKIFKKLGL